MANGAFTAPFKMGTPEVFCLFLRKLFSRYIAALFADYDVAPSYHVNSSLYPSLFISIGANAELPLLFRAAFDSVIWGTEYVIPWSIFKWLRNAMLLFTVSLTMSARPQMPHFMICSS